jgi:hypothetical protein
MYQLLRQICNGIEQGERRIPNRQRKVNERGGEAGFLGLVYYSTLRESASRDNSTRTLGTDPVSGP